VNWSFLTTSHITSHLLFFKRNLSCAALPLSRRGSPHEKWLDPYDPEFVQSPIHKHPLHRYKLMNAVSEKIGGTPCYLALQIRFNFPTCGVTRDMYTKLKREEAEQIITILSDKVRAKLGEFCTQVASGYKSDPDNDNSNLNVPTPAKKANKKAGR